jgi:hypothetical protein
MARAHPQRTIMSVPRQAVPAVAKGDGLSAVS